MLAYRWVKDSSLAKDMVHNLFVHLWEKGAQTIITGHIRHYLYRAITNQAINELKRRKRQEGKKYYSSTLTRPLFTKQQIISCCSRKYCSTCNPCHPAVCESKWSSRHHDLAPAAGCGDH
ncbi:RNA polymerase sigma factor [Chitinophaga sp.]|uniref:RNA polymerase sigma factor n=1 Tax=Chitinophaga sp. TaxID=1869181 RepID=UPI002F92B540